MRAEAVTPARLAALLRLFERTGSPCFCRYWHFTGTKNEWLERCAFRSEESAAELGAAVEAGADDGGGVVAVDDAGEVVGWMKLTWRAAVPKLRAQPVYRGLDLGDDQRTMSVGCFLVDPASRRSGVARLLLDEAVRVARARGAAAIEGYPRRSTEPLHDEEAFHGPESVYLAAGFAHVAGDAPYPVYRLELAP